MWTLTDLSLHKALAVFSFSCIYPTPLLIMHIIEVFTKGKHSEAANEDGWIVTNDFAAVIDGSTSKVKFRIGNKSKGQFATETIREAISHLPSNISMSEALLYLTEALASAVPDLLHKEAAYRLTCSAVIFSKQRKELWFIGDCQSRFCGITHTHPKLIDTLLTQIRCDIVKYALKKGYSTNELLKNDIGRNFIFNELREQCHFQNDTNPANIFRYPVLDGTPIPPELVSVVSVRDAKQLILASDGYPRLFDTLQESEDYLERVLSQDPLCIHENPATKCLIEGNSSFDDRTFLRLSINDSTL